MFSLISGFVRWLFAKQELSVLIIGLDHAGKTTLLEQMKGMYNKSGTIPLDKIPPTIGCNVGKMSVNSVNVTFWDLGGQAAMRTIWNRYCADAGGIIFVVDAADRSRLAQAREALDKVLEHKGVGSIPLLVMANKQDLPDAVSGDTVATSLALGARTERQRTVQCVSALTCEGVHEGISWLIHASTVAGRHSDAVDAKTS